VDINHNTYGLTLIGLKVKKFIIITIFLFCLHSYRLGSCVSNRHKIGIIRSSMTWKEDMGGKIFSKSDQWRKYQKKTTPQMVFLWKNIDPTYFVLTSNNFAIFHNLIDIDFGYPAVIWTSQTTPIFCIQGFSRVRNSMKKVSFVGN
jgi:hypothetical protein